MADVSLHRQFAGQARLVRLLLWRIGNTTDIDSCLEAARTASMVDAEDEAFLRICLAQEEEHRAETQAGGPDGEGYDVDEKTIRRLRHCVNKLNQADSA